MNRCNFALVYLRLFHLTNDLEFILQDILKVCRYHGLEQLWVILIVFTVHRNTWYVHGEIVNLEATMLDVVNCQFLVVSQPEYGNSKDKDNSEV